MSRHHQTSMRQKKCNYGKLWTTERQRGAHLHVYSWNVEDCGLHVVGFGLQGRRALLAGEEMRGGGVGGLQLLLLGGRLLVQTPEAALTAPAKPTGRTVPLRKRRCAYALFSLVTCTHKVSCLRGSHYVEPNVKLDTFWSRNGESD